MFFKRRRDSPGVSTCCTRHQNKHQIRDVYIYIYIWMHNLPFKCMFTSVQKHRNLISTLFLDRGVEPSDWWQLPVRATTLRRKPNLLSKDKKSSVLDQLSKEKLEPLADSCVLLKSMEYRVFPLQTQITSFQAYCLHNHPKKPEWQIQIIFLGAYAVCTHQTRSIFVSLILDLLYSLQSRPKESGTTQCEFSVILSTSLNTAALSGPYSKAQTHSQYWRAFEWNVYQKKPKCVI